MKLLNEKKRAFWSGIQSTAPGTTPDEAKKLFDEIIIIIPEISELRYYLVACYITGLQININTANAFKHDDQ